VRKKYVCAIHKRRPAKDGAPVCVEVRYGCEVVRCPETEDDKGNELRAKVVPQHDWNELSQCIVLEQV